MDQPIRLPEAERQAANSQSQKARGNLGPRDGIFHQTVSRPPVVNQVFLGSWMVDIHQEGHSQRSVPERRHMAHLRWCSGCAPRKPCSWDWGGDKMHCPPGSVCSPSIWSPEVLRPGKGTKHRPNRVCFCGVPKNLNLSGLYLGSARNSGSTSDSSWAEQPRA